MCARKHDAAEALADAELGDQALARESFARTSARVAVIKVLIAV
jgi:hypothetical protein